jgi:hypothetical protein
MADGAAKLWVKVTWPEPMSTNPAYRILAVEVRAGRFGYAVLETPRKLRDFGASEFDSTVTARIRIARLLRLSRPSIVILRGASVRYRQKNRHRRPIIRVVRSEARKLNISVARVSERQLNSFFERFGCCDKYSVAVLLAKWFPEISWRLPAKPKFYDPEPRALLYFDSVALAVAYPEQ